jgi:hypothetical protein
VLKVESIKIRNMHRSVTKAVNMNLIRRSTSGHLITRNDVPENSRGMSYRIGLEFRSKKAAAALAPDNIGLHPAAATNVCNNSECENLKCARVCGTLLYASIDGHFTGKPPVNSTSEHLSAYNYKNEPKDQYYVKSQEKKVVSAEELKSDYSTKDLKINSQLTDYMHSTDDIFSKTQ